MDDASQEKAHRFRMRAQEVRRDAESVHLLGARQSMLQIAQAYDLLAEHADSESKPA
jgi:hypothetical protein